MILLKWLGWLVASFFFSVAMGLAGAFLYLNPQIPEISSFTNVALKAPLRILSSDDRLIQEYGERPLAIFLDKTVVTAQNSKWRFQGDIGERRNFRNLWIEIKKGARESHRYGEEKRCHEPP